MTSPINADGTEIEDAGCTHHHIESDKDVTVDLAKAPLSHYLEEKNINKWQLTGTVNRTKSLQMMCFASATQSKPDSQVSLCVFFFFPPHYFPHRQQKEEVKSETDDMNTEKGKCHLFNSSAECSES